MKSIKITLFFLAFATITGCKTPIINKARALKAIPESYSENTIPDSTNTANIQWKNYFKDQNLVTLIDSAIVNNQDILMAMQRIQIAKSDVLLQRSALLPQVDASVAGGVSRFGKYTSDGAGNAGTPIHRNENIPTVLPDYFVGLQTNWEVDIWGKLKNKKRAATLRFLAGVEAKNVVLTNLIAEVAINYYELIALDNRLDAVQEYLKLQEKALQIMKFQKEAAMVNRLAVEQFEANVVNSKAREIEISQEIIITENTINLLLGRFPQAIQRTREVIDAEFGFATAIGIPSQLMQNRPDVRQAELELFAAKADVKSAKAAFYPSLNIDGSIGFQAFRSKLLFSTPESVAYAIAGNLTAPLLNRRAIKAEFAMANATQIELLYNYQKTVITAFVEVNNQITSLQNIEKLLTLKMQEAAIYDQSIETSLTLFKANRANYLEVLLSQQNAIEAKMQLLDTKKDRLVNRVNIYKALGGGWK